MHQYDCFSAEIVCLDYGIMLANGSVDGQFWSGNFTLKHMLDVSTFAERHLC